MTEQRTTESNRATFSLTANARGAYRQASDLYGVTQSEIASMAPFIFMALAEKSLARRRNELSKNEVLVEQARRSLYAARDHVLIGAGAHYADLAMDVERTSIARKQIHGPDEETIEEDAPAWLPGGDPFVEDVSAFIETCGTPGIAEAFRSEFGDYHDRRSNADSDDEEESKLTQDQFDQILASVTIERRERGKPQTELRSTPIQAKPSRAAPLRGGREVERWCLEADDLSVDTETGVDALAELLVWLRQNHDSSFSAISSVRGRKRYLLASTPEALYPGRPDLAEHSREIAPGWHMGTNYSAKDLERWMERAVEACGLKWGRDVRLRKY